ncbi:MAG: hypothetical protein EAX96_17760 [Candidatus Lokiarchaeota archaeon]|nr:hypothetical protein [Candidatus Lokiarchaeota archaeon]
MPKRKKRSKRGYPIAIFIGIDDIQANIWQIFSEVVKPYDKIKLGNRKRKNNKQILDFHEAIIDSIRPLLKQGIRSILISNPIKTDYADIFLEHVKKHHQWLIQEKASNAASFARFVGVAGNLEEVQALIHTEKIKKILYETLDKETDKIINILEKRLNEDINGKFLIFSLKDIEKLIYSLWELLDAKPEYLLLTDKYLAKSKQKNRLNKLMQVSKNKGMKVKVISEEETGAGKRVAQFGGIVCLTNISS